MYVCVCNGVTDHEIREVAAAGCRSVPELTMRTGCGACCGSCLEAATQLLAEADRNDTGGEESPLRTLPLLSHAA